MKMTAIILLATCLQASAKLNAQQINLKEQNVSLKKVFNQIEKQSNYFFIYRNEWLSQAKEVDVNLKNATIEQAMTACLKGQPLTYTIVNKNIVIRKAPSSKTGKQKTIQQLITIQLNGTVVDSATGDPLAGVTIKVKGSTTGTTTDANGHFSLNVPDDAVLEVSYLGYSAKEVSVNGRSNIQISLSATTTGLNQLVVIGYGTVKKKDLTGSVASIEGSDLQNIPAAGVNQILEGRAPGVKVTTTSGAPGAASIIRVRGGNSIQGNNSPLYVVDGIIVGQNFNLNQLNISDIKSIDVLKDATAIAIYGTRGSNGVVLITTKSGAGVAPGKAVVNVSAYTGVQKFVNNVHFLSGPQMAAYANEDAEYRNVSLPFPDPGKVPNTHWIDLLTQDASIYNVNASVSGRSQNGKLNYYISGGYFDQDGIVKNSGFKKYNLTTNFDLKISDYVKMGLRLHIARRHTNNNKVGFGTLFIEAGYTPRAVYDSAGNFTALNPVSGSVRQNMLAQVLLQTDYTNATNLLSSAYLQIEPVKNLIIKSTFAPVINYSKHNIYNPGKLPQNFIINDGGDGSVHSTNSINLLNENTITYTTNIGAGQKLELLGGFTWQTEQSNGVQAHGYAYFNDATTFNNLGVGNDPTRNEIGTDYGSYQLVSWLGRVNYSYRNKYLLTLVGRVDGSSRFATTKNKYGFFPSAALAWKISEEPFIKELNFFDLLKLRTSYGISGSQAIGSFRTLAILNGVSTLFDNTLQSGVNAGRPANPDLKWETTKELDVGLEATMFKGRLSFTADYYHKLTTGLLLNVQIPEQTGYTSKLQNLGSIRNQGIDIGISSENISNNNFRWSTTVNLSANRNKVLDLAGVDYIDIVSPANQGGPGGRLIVGEPAPVFVGVNYLGTWKNQHDIDASGLKGQKIGGAHFEDTNGDGQITVDDFHVIGSPQPLFYGSIGNTFSFKNFMLDIFFQGTYGNDIFNSLTQTAFFGRPETNKYAIVLNRWTPDNPDSDIPRAGTITSFSQIKNNSQEIEDGSYLRLKSVKLSYSLPVQKLGLDRAGFTNLSVFFSGSNLLLFSKFKLFDPETSRYGTTNTSNKNRIGFSQGEYPYSRTYTFGINASF